MKDLLNYLASSLVDNPESVKIEEREEERTIYYTLQVDEKDMGKIIGKQGKNAQAIRTLMKAAGAKTDKRIIVDII
ncbi:MAG: KH domain-containing protein [Clostridia bacterium]|nr:KH domain-containing protein [Oscillospiraceae bacterium]MBR4892979.1 KH domain-containing protein [Clostridia bacterium]